MHGWSSNVSLKKKWNVRVRLATAENWNWKLKIEKHCSKIIFKCVNGTVEPIFNEKVAKKCSLWDPWTKHGNTVYRRKSKKSYCWEKKKKKFSETQTTLFNESIYNFFSIRVYEWMVVSNAVEFLCMYKSRDLDCLELHMHFLSFEYWFLIRPYIDQSQPRCVWSRLCLDSK